jgi:translation initiation factor eIF-2B subunit delta
VRDYTPPARGTLAHDFETHLKPHLQFLIDCRPLTVSMANAIKYFKVQISLTLGKELNDARLSLVDTTEAYIHERIVLADKLISQNAAKKIADGDVVMTYSLSDVTEQTFAQAQSNGTKFRVVVVDGPYGHGFDLVRRIVRRGIECDYVLLSGASYKMTEVTKVILGADAMMSNGALLANAGTASIALLAKAFHVPVLVVCETYKFCERVQLDSITSNELLDPEALLQRTPASSPLRGWRDNPNLKLLALRYDITPIDLIDVVVTEVGLVPPTSVPVIVREFRREVQM